jgi:hypothetical protein
MSAGVKGRADLHTVVGSSGLFRSAGLDTNEIFLYRFDRPGNDASHGGFIPRWLQR